MKYKYRPKTKEELMKIIEKEIYEIQGTFSKPNWEADLNGIDTSLITDMSNLFVFVNGLEKFNGNISKWDVSNVKNMASMFFRSEFNGDISNWNVSNVKYMSNMFRKSKFNRDISNWDVSNVEDTEKMFMENEYFNQNISNWNISNVNNFSWMFYNSKFNGDISNWKIKDSALVYYMFTGSKFNQDIGSWPLKQKTGLENISVSPEYDKLPDKILYPETIANIFIRSINNPDNTFNIDSFKQILKKYLEKHKELYKNKGYKSNIVNKLILNDIVDILKHLKDKDMQQKFMEITMNKDDKRSVIDIE